MNNGIQQLEQFLQNHSQDYQNYNGRLGDVAYKRLYDALKIIELDADEPLPELWLSKVLGISRTPIREALQQLAADGIIKMSQGRAMTKAGRSAQEVFEALHVRELLEPQSVKLLVGVITSDQLQRVQALTQLMAQAAEAGDRASWSRADREWHEVLCNACPNKLLGEMVLLARNRMYHRGSDELVPLQYLIDGTAEHQAIIDAIVNQDGDGAAQRMLQHLGTLRENIFRRFTRP